MSQAEELLSTLSIDEIPAEPEGHIVIDKDRYITVPEKLKRIAVQYDNNIETVTFDCPRYWDDKDLSTMYIYVNYLTPHNSKGRCLVKNVRVDEEDSSIIHFEWTIGKEITLFNGSIRFLVCAVQTDEEGNDEIHWNTEINQEMTVSEGIECVDVIPMLYPDIVNDLLTRMDTVVAANTPILDKSLTQSGLAADAKVTGDALNNEKTERQISEDKIVNDFNLEINKEISERQTSDITIRDELLSRINAISNGSPLAVSSTNEMTDTNRIYVYTIDGKWYYHNGTTWVSGGIYQSTGINNNSISREHLKIPKFSKILVGELKIHKNNEINTISVECLSDSLFLQHEGGIIYVENKNKITKDYTTAEVMYIVVYYDEIGSEYKLDILTLSELNMKTNLNSVYIISFTYGDLFLNTFSDDHILTDNIKVLNKEPNYMFNIVTGFINVDINNKTINIDLENGDFFAIVPSMKNTTGTLFVLNENKELPLLSSGAAQVLLFDTLNNNFIIKEFGDLRYINNLIPILSIYANKIYPIIPPHNIKINNVKYYDTVISLPEIPEECLTVQRIVDCTRDIFDPSNTTNIVLVGDSITHGQGGTGWDQNGDTIIDDFKRSPNSYCWAKLFKEYIESNYNAVVTNNGCTGTNTTFLANNLETLIPVETDIVIISYGTNNRGLGVTDNYDNVYTTMINDFNTIINYCKMNNIKYIIVSPIPSSVDDETRIVGEERRFVHMFHINNIISAISSINNFEYVNMYNLITYYCKTRGINWEDHLKDGLHPNDEGYLIMFEQLLNGLGLGPTFN